MNAFVGGAAAAGTHFITTTVLKVSQGAIKILLAVAVNNPFRAEK